jgi:hypothetical protein
VRPKSYPVAVAVCCNVQADRPLPLFLRDVIRIDTGRVLKRGVELSFRPDDCRCESVAEKLADRLQGLGFSPVVEDV